MKAAQMVLRENKTKVQEELVRRPKTRRLIRAVTVLSFVFLPSLWLAVAIAVIAYPLPHAVAALVIGGAVSALFPWRRVLMTVVSVGIVVSVVTMMIPHTWWLLPPVVGVVVSGVACVIVGLRLVRATVAVANEIGFAWSDGENADEYIQHF